MLHAPTRTSSDPPRVLPCRAAMAKMDSCASAPLRANLRRTIDTSTPRPFPTIDGVDCASGRGLCVVGAVLQLRTDMEGGFEQASVCVCVCVCQVGKGGKVW